MHPFLDFLFNNVAKEQVLSQLITICLPYLLHQKCVGQCTSTSPVFRTVNFVPCCKTELRSCSFQCRPLANVISFSDAYTRKNPSPFPVRGSILRTFNPRDRTQANAQEKFVAMFSTLSYFAFHACSKFQDISINFCAKSRERRCHKK